MDVFCPGLCSESQWDNPGDEAGSERNTAASTISLYFDTHPLSYSNVLGSNTIRLVYFRFRYICSFELQNLHHPSSFFKCPKLTFFSFPCFLCHLPQSFWNILLHRLPAGTVLQCVTPQISTSLWNTLHSIIKVGSVPLHVV